ncbi:PIN domain-containing protein [Pigmentiphaga soli]
MSSIVRPLLLDLAGDGWFAPVWSARIGEEWRRNAARIWGRPAAELDAEWASMCSRFAGADPGDLSAYEAGLRYSDPKDWHVIAAGLASRARAPGPATPLVRVLTWNLKDFDRAELRRQGLAAWDPDRQLADWLQAGPARIAPRLAGATDYARALGREEPLVDTLRRERLFRTARLMQAIGTEPAGKAGA